MQPVPISPEAIKAEISFYRYMNAHFIVAENFRHSVSSIPDLNRYVSRVCPNIYREYLGILKI